MRKSMILTICILVFVLCSLILPSSSAETFKVGNKVSKTDEGTWGFRWFYFDSGCIVQADSGSIDYLPLILDGNLSTGIDHNFGKYEYNLEFVVYFPYALNVSKIVFKPYYNGSTSFYNIFLKYKNMALPAANDLNYSKTFHVNGLMDGITIFIRDLNYTHGGYNKTTQFYFNDVIIEYTPETPNTNGSDKVQPQINQINLDIDSIYNDIIILKKDITNVKENITNNIDNNITAYDDSELNNQINNLSLKIDSLKENLTIISNSIPMEYNDSALKSNIFNLESNIFNLESNNILINQKIGNLTLRIENLTLELEKLSSDVQNIQSMGGSGEVSGEKNNRVYEYSYGIFIGVIIIILLLIVLRLSIIVLKNKSQHGSKPTLENGIYSNIMHEILFEPNQQNANKSNDELNIALDNKYRNGDMSEKTYNSLKNLIQKLENTRQKEK
jgi:hypothetical protein